MMKEYKMSDITKLKIKEKAQQRKCKYAKQEMKEKYDHNNGKHWWTDGVSNIFSKVCPSGFYKGRVIQ